MWRIEDWLGGFWTAFLDLFFISLAALALLDGLISGENTLLCIAIFAMAAPFGPRHLWWLWDEARRGSHPLAVAVAMRQQPRWALWRPVACLWWLACFAGGCAFGWFNETTAGRHERALSSVLTFGYLYAANGYLLLAISAWTSRRILLERIWRLRILIDLLVAALAAWAPAALR